MQQLVAGLCIKCNSPIYLKKINNTLSMTEFSCSCHKSELDNANEKENNAQKFVNLAFASEELFSQLSENGIVDDNETITKNILDRLEQLEKKLSKILTQNSKTTLND